MQSETNPNATNTEEKWVSYLTREICLIYMTSWDKKFKDFLRQKKSIQCCEYLNSIILNTKMKLSNESCDEFTAKFRQIISLFNSLMQD